jgi:predicted nucleic acid-binding protein
VTYLDTGCLVKLYYPEPDTSKVVALVSGKALCHTPLHELEFLNALQLKRFFGSATVLQVSAARALIAADLQAGVLVSSAADWRSIYSEAVKLAEQFTGTIGCRSLDVLHCAAAKVLSANEFISNDLRQGKLAAAMGLNLLTF